MLQAAQANRPTLLWIMPIPRTESIFVIELDKEDFRLAKMIDPTNGIDQRHKLRSTTLMIGLLDAKFHSISLTPTSNLITFAQMQV